MATREGNKHRRRARSQKAARVREGVTAPAAPEPAPDHGRDQRSVHPVARLIFRNINARPYRVRLALWRKCVAVEERRTRRKLKMARQKDGIHPVREHDASGLRKRGPSLSRRTLIKILQAAASDLRTKVLRFDAYRGWALEQARDPNRPFPHIPVSAGPFHECFRSWEAACEAAGLLFSAPTEGYTRAALLEILALVAAWTGRECLRFADVGAWAGSPGGQGYAATHSRGAPKSTGPFRREFGSWNEALAAAGLLPAKLARALAGTDQNERRVVATRAMKAMTHLPDDELFELVREASAANGGGYIRCTRYDEHRRRVVDEARARGIVVELVDASVLVRRFGRWGNVLYGAGLIDAVERDRLAQRGQASEDEIDDAVSAAVDEHGPTISYRRYDKWRDELINTGRAGGRRIPTHQTVATRIGDGSWPAAVKAVIERRSHPRLREDS